MKTTSSHPLAIAMAAVLAVAWASTGLLRATEATIESTCAAAAARDRRVDVRFCKEQFLSYSGAAEDDVLGLARTAALIGVSLGDDAEYDIHEGTIRAPPGAAEKGKAAVRECIKSYDAVGMAFAEAADEVGARRFELARQNFGRVPLLVRRCDAAIEAAGAKIPPTLLRYGEEFRQMAVIGVAITNLIK